MSQLFQITPAVHSVGILNPTLRLFDITMKTEYGTTYNSFLIQGSQKKALIDAVHFRKFEEHLENLKVLGDVSEIDYIIINHTEPDHSGSLVRLLELAPQATVIASPTGIRFLKKICNRDFPFMIAEDGMTLDLGGKTLQFILAPNLHWPDSMFTYLPEEQILFSCDFFGAHYCETPVLDSQLYSHEKYEQAFYAYYQAIFAPFKKFVLAGLKKIKDLPIRFICTSHGPVLDQFIPEAVKLYTKWSSPVTAEKPQAAIIYVSAYGYTQTLAKIAEKELSGQNFSVKLFDLTQIGYEKAAEAVLNSKLFLIGSPTLNRNAPPPMWNFLGSLDVLNLQGKSVGVFGSYGWSGEAVPAIVSYLTHMRCKVYGEGFRIVFKPSEEEQQAMGTYVRELIASVN